MHTVCGEYTHVCVYVCIHTHVPVLSLNRCHLVPEFSSAVAVGAVSNSSCSQPSNIPPSLTPHLALRGTEEHCNAHAEHLAEGPRAWGEMPAEDRIIQEGLGCSGLFCSHSHAAAQPLWHWSFSSTSGVHGGGPDLSFFFSFSFPLPHPPCPALKKDFSIRMAP